jgi:beta-glucosidase
MKNLIVLILLLLFTIFSCTNKETVYLNPNQPVEEHVEYLLSLLTLEEKVAMLHGNSKFTIAGVERLGIPQWSMSDGPNGVREEINKHDWNPAGWTTDSSSYLATGTLLAATWNPELAYQFGKALGSEARYRKKDVILAPGININRTPLCGRNFEYMGEDPFLITQMVVPIIKGIQENDVAACVKHFVVNNQEYDRFKVNTELDERTLREIYLPGFKAAVKKGGALTVMSAYNKLRGQYCSENEYLLNTILKKEWNFEGVVISDWNGTHSTKGAALGGLDVEMGTNAEDYDDYYFADALLDAVKNGEIDEYIVDDKVKRILRVMIKTNIFNDKRAQGAFTIPSHFQLSKRIAQEGIVLLKNENNLLPLKKDQFKSIAVIGDNATRKHSYGGGSSMIKAKYEISPLEGLKNKLGNAVQLNMAQGYERTTIFSWDEPIKDTFDPEKAKEMREEAVEAAKKSEAAIIFCGLNHDFDTEGWDRKDMKLPYEQDLLINAVKEANSNTIVVLIAGSPVDMNAWLDKIQAVVLGWYAGMESGNAIADVLFGDVNPSGKLPFTFPKELMDSPVHKMGNYPGTEYTVNYNEGMFVGYRYFDTENIKPLFCFGHGLSYTNYEYGNLKLNSKSLSPGDSVKINFKIKNTGKYAGAEVAQLYISDIKSSVKRPAKELKGFKKVFLHPGEEKEVSFTIKKDALTFYDVATSNWVAETGKFEILIGSSVQDIRLKENFRLTE